MPSTAAIKKVIDEKVRPYAQMHGGDIEIVKLTKAGVLQVRLHGSCDGCSMASVTLQYGVQNILFEEFPKDDITLEVVT